MTRSVPRRLPDRPALSEHPDKEAYAFRRAPAAGNQQKMQTRKLTSEQSRHLVSLGSSWFSPLVGELCLRDSLNDQDQATFRTGDWLSLEVQARPRSSQGKRLYHPNRKVTLR